MQIRSSARPMIAARLFAALSFTGMVATGSFIALVSHADTAWAAPKKKKKPKAAATSSDDTATTSTPDSSPKSTDDLMSDSAKTKSNAQIKADKDSAADADKPERQAITEPDAWERPPVEEEKPKHTAIVPVEERKGDGRHYDLALMLGWAGQTGKYFASDPWGLGFGLRGAYEFDNHLVLGVGYEYFIGSSTPPSANIGFVKSSSVNYMLAHAEVGYNFWLAENRVILRPSLWVGAAIGTQNPPMATGTSGVETSLFFAPGLTFHYLLGDNGWFLGADARFTIITGNGANGFLALGTFGLRFGH